MAVLDRLDHEYGFSKKERLLVHQIVRTQYFVALGFQMLANETLTTAEWKKMRTYAREKADYLAKLAPGGFLVMDGEQRAAVTELKRQPLSFLRRPKRNERHSLRSSIPTEGEGFSVPQLQHS